MKIYTKTGDIGQTGLLGGDRVWKHNPLVEALGNLDELNAWIGRVIGNHQPPQATESSDLGDHSWVECLTTIQHELFCLGVELGDQRKQSVSCDWGEPTLRLERQIDQWEQTLPALTQFILPGGSPLSADLHYTRCLCRRTERSVVQFCTDNGQTQPNASRHALLAYLNRLSDYFFVMARYANQQDQRQDIVWKGLS